MPKQSPRAPRANPSSDFDRRVADLIAAYPPSEPFKEISQTKLAKKLKCSTRRIQAIEHRFFVRVLAAFKGLGCEDIGDVDFQR